MNNKTEDSEGLFGGSRRVPVVIRSVEDGLGHVVGTAEIESDGVNMVARITLDHDMARRLNTVLVEFSFLTGPEAYQDEPEVVETNDVQLPIFEGDSGFRVTQAELDEEPVSLHALIRESLNRQIDHNVFLPPSNQYDLVEPMTALRGGIKFGGVKMEKAKPGELKLLGEEEATFDELVTFEPYIKQRLLRMLREEHAKFERREQYGACPCGCGGIYDPPITKEIDDV